MGGTKILVLFMLFSILVKVTPVPFGNDDEDSVGFGASYSCPLTCSQNSNPVCATNGLTYENECLLRNAKQCGNNLPDLAKERDGKCPDCPLTCPQESNKVCGTNGLTYENECLLQNAKKCGYLTELDKAHDGECPECSLKCAYDPKPVCGTNGRTYDNDCYLEYAKTCGNLPDLAVKHTGECADEKSSFDDLLQVNEDLNDGDAVMSADIDSVPSLLEGDIVVSPPLIQMLNYMRQAEDDDDNIALFDAINNGAWPQATVPYTYQDTNVEYRLRSSVNMAIAEYKAKTCIKWVYYRPGSTMPRNHVVFFQGGGCFSYIGRQRSMQRISLGNGCTTKGIAIHEMMHALGFFHEQSRRDRERFISINWGNIPSRVRYNFEMYRASQAKTLGARYDKQSIMHYGNYAFAIDRRVKTITSLANRNEVLGQRRGLSKIDIQQLNTYYQCSGKEKENKDCKDMHAFCRDLTGWCDNSWVKTNCEKSCKKCTTTTVVPKNCKNLNTNCDSWKNKGYCKQYYVGYMSQNCKKSCGLC